MTAATLPAAEATASVPLLPTEDEFALPALLAEEEPDTWGSVALLLSLPALLWLGSTLAHLL